MSSVCHIVLIYTKYVNRNIFLYLIYQTDKLTPVFISLVDSNIGLFIVKIEFPRVKHIAYIFHVNINFQQVIDMQFINIFLHSCDMSLCVTEVQVNQEHSEWMEETWACFVTVFQQKITTFHTDILYDSVLSPKLEEKTICNI